MANLSNLSINDTGFINLPTGTTAQRPASPVAGQLRVNTSFTPPQLELYNGTAWRDFRNNFTAGLGLSSASPATSALEILNYNPQAPDGLYWINVQGTARQIWCDMKNGGWLFAGRMQGTTWGYDDAKWTNTAVLNDTSNPTTNQDVKTYAWFVPIKKARISLSAINNYLEERWDYSNGLVGVFSAPVVNTNINWDPFPGVSASRQTQHTRQKFEEWFNKSNNVNGTLAEGLGGPNYSGRGYINGAAGTFWSNCNMRGVNMLSNSGGIKVRYGTMLNNEVECASCDYYWGIGFAGTPFGNTGAGKRANYTGSGYGWSTATTGWVFVQ
jgi:hypothetical protein